MADKKDNSKGKGGGGGSSFDMTVMAIIALISFLFVLWPTYGEALFNSFMDAYGELARGGAIKIATIIQGVLSFFGFLSVIGIAFVTFRFARLRADYVKDMLDILPEESAPREALTRWRIIKERALSQSASDRKVAIIEADAMLDEMVKKMGYSGETLADRLKNIETSDFLTLNAAWEAHKFRNKIAHEAHEVTLRDAKRVIALYEEVFQEFTYI